MSLGLCQGWVNSFTWSITSLLALRKLGYNSSNLTVIIIRICIYLLHFVNRLQKFKRNLFNI